MSGVDQVSGKRPSGSVARGAGEVQPALSAAMGKSGEQPGPRPDN